MPRTVTGIVVSLPGMVPWGAGPSSWPIESEPETGVDKNSAVYPELSEDSSLNTWNHGDEEALFLRVVPL